MLLGRTHPLVFREGIVQATASRLYRCAGNGDPAARQHHPRCPRHIGKGYGGYADRPHLRRGNQRHCHYCASMFFLDVEASFPPIRWAKCLYCEQEHMTRRTCYSPTGLAVRSHEVAHPVYDPRHDSCHVTYHGACGCPGAVKEREDMRRMNEEIQKRLAPVMASFFASPRSTQRQRRTR